MPQSISIWPEVESLQLEQNELVTYQVTMIGKDGIIVASDKSEGWTEQDPGSGYGTRTTTKATKIFLSPDAQYAWTFSGGPCSRIAASYLSDAVRTSSPQTDEEMKGLLRDAGDQTLQTYPGRNPVFTDVVVLTSGRTGSIYRASISSKTIVETVEGGKSVSGDWKNLASFFPEHFYAADSTVDYLALLAAYAVRMGNVFNPTHVEGLDLALFEYSVGGFRFLDASFYWERAGDLDKILKGSIVGAITPLRFL